MLNVILLAIFLLAGCNSAQNGAPAGAADLTQPLHHKTGYNIDAKSKYGRLYWHPKALYEALRTGTIPDEWDWRAQGKKTPILNQGNCGSCWAFGSVETEIASALIFKNQVLALSPQEIVAWDNTNGGCGGGNYAKHFMETYGAVLENQCPYTASNHKCQPDPRKLTPAFKPKSVVFIGEPDRSPTFDEVRAFIYQYGYVGVSAGADNAWESQSAVIPRCNGTSVNHEIAAYAYSVSRKSLKIQNSWGKDVGDPADPGTMEIPWGCDNLAYDAGAVVTDAQPCQPPKLDLPKEVIVSTGQEVTLAVKEEQGVTYQWSQDGSQIGSGSELTYTPAGSGDLMVQATNSCGTAQMKVLVSVQ